MSLKLPHPAENPCLYRHLPKDLAAHAHADQYVTVDESKWLVRSANFYQALHSGSDTFQHGHPGVTIMWSAAGYLLRFLNTSRSPGQFS